jgi:hypothetical protein
MKEEGVRLPIYQSYFEAQNGRSENSIKIIVGCGYL